MDVSTPPSLDLACPQAEVDNDKYVHMFRDRGVDKIKYGHEGIYIYMLLFKNDHDALMSVYIYIYIYIVI